MEAKGTNSVFGVVASVEMRWVQLGSSTFEYSPFNDSMRAIMVSRWIPEGVEAR